VKRLGPAALVAGCLVVAACAGAGATAEAGALPPADPAELEYAPELRIDLATFRETSSGLYLQDVTEGEGPVARRGSLVWIRYVGRLPDGTIFDGNLGGDPFNTRLGGTEVIRGWNEGIPGMRRGGIRRLVVPPHLGYGSRRQGDVPPGATLIFDLELVDIR
jgi:FKBP-type peptidyl-prolyl cis-trans isomerase